MAVLSAELLKHRSAQHPPPPSHTHQAPRDAGHTQSAARSPHGPLRSYLLAAREGARHPAPPLAERLSAPHVSTEPAPTAAGGRATALELRLSITPDAARPASSHLKALVRAQMRAAAAAPEVAPRLAEGILKARESLTRAVYWGKNGPCPSSPAEANTIRLTFKSAEAARLARCSALLWVDLLGTRAKRSPFQVRVHGVNPVGSLAERTVRGLTDRLTIENAEWAPDALQSADWQRPDKAKRGYKGALVLSFASAQAVDIALANGRLKYGNLLYTTMERGGAATEQCSRCFKFGHRADRCAREAMCGHCKGSHLTGDPKCKGRSHLHRQCRNCEEPHASYHPLCAGRPGRQNLPPPLFNPRGAFAAEHE